MDKAFDTRYKDCESYNKAYEAGYKGGRCSRAFMSGYRTAHNDIVKVMDSLHIRYEDLYGETTSEHYKEAYLDLLQYINNEILNNEL